MCRRYDEYGCQCGRSHPFFCNAVAYWIRPSKQLPADINEVDRVREDDERNNLNLLVYAISRWMQRERLVTARALQQQRVASGAIAVDIAPSDARAKGNGKTMHTGRARGDAKVVIGPQSRELDSVGGGTRASGFGRRPTVR